jgi:hypothetical protein
MTVDDVSFQQKPEFVFLSEHFEEHKMSDDDLIKLVPYAISMTQDPTRPTLLMKDEKGEHTLPVALNPLEAGMTLSQANRSLAPTTPHKVTEILLKSLDIKIERCVFVEIKGHHQYVRLFMDNHPQYGSVKVRADEAMSLCLHLNVEFFATPAFMRRSKVMSSEIAGLSQQLAANPAVLARTHEYLM